MHKLVHYESSSVQLPVFQQQATEKVVQNSRCETLYLSKRESTKHIIDKVDLQIFEPIFETSFLESVEKTQIQSTFQDTSSQILQS